MHTRDDILEFLAPSTIHTERDIDDRCKVLSDLRDKLCETLCELFPEYGSRELINRRVPHTYASDVFVIGNSIRNSMIDKGLRAVFKPAAAHNLHDEDNDVSFVNQTDVMETCLLLRDSVVSLKVVILDLQQEVKELKTQVGRMERKRADQPPNSAGPPTVPVTVEHPTNPDSESSTTGGPIPAHDLTNPPQSNEAIRSERPVQQTNNYHLPSNHQKKLLRGRMMISNGTIGTSGGNHSFRGALTSRANQLRSIYIGNAVRNTSASSVRDHLTSIGLADDIADIQLIPSRFNNDTSAFCVTLNSIAAEKRAYNSQWPDQVVVKPYRAPRQKSYKQNQMNNTNQPRNNYSNSKWNKTKNQRNNYYQEQPHHVQPLMQSQFRQPLVQQPTSLPWGGIYPGYNGQFMPLMNLSNTL